MKPTHIADCVRSNLEIYLRDLGNSEPHSMYGMVVSVVEKPLLELVMQRTDNNQSKAAQWLGLNRNTLRKKLLDHKLID
ncbi:MAG: Fis family transcriptional regulator [Rhodoferax sp.]|jgi:Fis family transcriptional regulator|uniref:helix-turn-helix domain-containing protein n=1 Tax=Rhodoferax sp. TaxID=50421 RepID=UPI001B4D6D53|nr:helix-turn-helix domain-containing protein [Rhodoferax sp.]MBP9906145.1 Fis family transcriptional regulator [Rhodoferax sp.]